MSGIDAYFTRLAKPAEPAPKRKVGRPSKKAELAAAAEKRAALEEEEEQWQKACEVACDEQQLQDEQAARKRQKRDAGHVNWSLPENFEKMERRLSNLMDSQRYR